MNHAPETDGGALVAAYFAERTAQARAEVEQAKDKLAEKEAEENAFLERGELPAARSDLATLQPEFDLCAWATRRIGKVAFEMSPEAAAADHRARVERASVINWLETHGYSVPAAYRETAG